MFSNFKNSLKSLGSRIVAIHDLSEKFQRRQAFRGRAAAPIATRIVIVEASDGDRVSIKALFVLPHRRLHRVCDSYILLVRVLQTQARVAGNARPKARRPDGTPRTRAVRKSSRGYYNAALGVLIV
jgi:hypothetical protein